MIPLESPWGRKPLSLECSLECTTRAPHWRCFLQYPRITDPLQRDLLVQNSSSHKDGCIGVDGRRLLEGLHILGVHRGSLFLLRLLLGELLVFLLQRHRSSERNLLHSRFLIPAVNEFGYLLLRHRRKRILLDAGEGSILTRRAHSLRIYTVHVLALLPIQFDEFPTRIMITGTNKHSLTRVSS